MTMHERLWEIPYYYTGGLISGCYLYLSDTITAFYPETTSQTEITTVCTFECIL